MSLTFLADSGYTLRSEELEVHVLPREGSRIASLRSRSSGLEFLTQSHRQGPYPSQGLDTPFQAGSCAGIEECLPSVGPCGSEADGGPVPDHGDFWQLQWDVLQSTDHVLTIEAQGFSRLLQLRKTLTLQGNQLHVAYSIRNMADVPQSFLYACHPLFAVDPGDTVILPDCVQTLRLDYSRHSRLGFAGDNVRWPEANSGVQLDHVLAADAGTADMLYTGRLSIGECAIQRKATGQMMRVLFPVETLPYLGVWLCYGGWPDDTTEHSQYAVALEPTTAPWNTLAQAQTERAATTLIPGGTYEFEITFQVV